MCASIVAKPEEPRPDGMGKLARDPTTPLVCGPFLEEQIRRAGAASVMAMDSILVATYCCSQLDPLSLLKGMPWLATPLQILRQMV